VTVARRGRAGPAGCRLGLAGGGGRPSFSVMTEKNTKRPQSPGKTPEQAEGARKPDGKPAVDPGKTPGAGGERR
jgi:hypothetical protein